VPGGERQCERALGCGSEPKGECVSECQRAGVSELRKRSNVTPTLRHSVTLALWCSVMWLRCFRLADTIARGTPRRSNYFHVDYWRQACPIVRTR
jgi:hypothetical protein